MPEKVATDLQQVTLAYYDYRVKVQLEPHIAQAFDDGDIKLAGRKVYYAFIDAARADGFRHFPQEYSPELFKRFPIQLVW